MADLEAVKFVESYKLERFITDGLNNGKFGHGAVEILSEIYVLERDDVAPVVHGRWIEQEDLNMDTYYDCSACGESFCLIDGSPQDNLYCYCPNCGAKMDERRNDETERGIG